MKKISEFEGIGLEKVEGDERPEAPKIHISLRPRMLFEIIDMCKRLASRTKEYDTLARYKELADFFQGIVDECKKGRE